MSTSTQALPRTEATPPKKVGQPILLTNDDGYDAIGLSVLWKAALMVWGNNIQVVAPKRCWSQKSHATMTREPIQVDPLRHDFMEGSVVDAFPADCVRIGLQGQNLFEGQKPLVLAGINPGANVGMDIFYSGTVAAAREALAFGCPAVALSQLHYKAEPNHWDQTLEWAAVVLERLAPFILERDPAVWNINFPRSTSTEKVPPIKVVPMSTDPLAVSYFPPANGDRKYTFNASYFDRPAAKGTDVSELFAGRITVTPLGLDHTLHDFIE